MTNKLDSALAIANSEKLKEAARRADAEIEKTKDREEKKYEDRMTWKQGDIVMLDDQGNPIDASDK